MKKLLAILLVPLFLAGCVTTQQSISPTVTQYRSVSIPSSLYNCPTVGKLPGVKGLTDAQVANVLVRFANANKTCRQSLASIASYNKKSGRTIR
jgi:hypothetical protein